MTEGYDLDLIGKLDFSGLCSKDVECVKNRISEDGYFHGYIPGKGFSFILNNYRVLSDLGILEQNWMEAYIHASNFEATSLDTLKEIFDLCDKSKLQEKFPIYVGEHFSNGERFSLFRGCAGPNHRKGMSWTSSLDKAIWYAAHHAKLHSVGNIAVYAAVVERDEIYCCGSHYDYDFIVIPSEWWQIKVPAVEFRLDRPR